MNDLTELLTKCSLNNDYEHSNKLIEICKSFENKKIELFAKFLDEIIPIYDANIVGNIFEDVFFPIIKKHLDDFERGPKQASPDYYGSNKKFEFELKAFTHAPGFDIGNFMSYVNHICIDKGLLRKLFNTKYLIFEYEINDKHIKILKFHYLNVYNLVSYSGKYPISLQVKNNIWYNIRSDSVKKWYLKEKDYHIFIKNLIECINICPQYSETDKKSRIDSINKQYEFLKNTM